MGRVALYPGSFDPVTKGHLDILCRALSLFDEVIIAVGTSREKDPLFTVDERIAILRECTKGLRVTVVALPGLLAPYADESKATIIRAMRAVSDFDYEFQMALTNRELSPDVETIFLMTSKEWLFLSSRLVKELASHGADVSRFVPPAAAMALQKKFGRSGNSSPKQGKAR